MADLTVAKTILEQLGGNRFRAMTGAKNFLGADYSLTFSLPGGGGFTKGGINKVVIELTPMDVYTVTFYRMRRSKGTLLAKVVSKFEDVYCDGLRSLFERETGLATSL